MRVCVRCQTTKLPSFDGFFCSVTLSVNQGQVQRLYSGVGRRVVFCTSVLNVRNDIIWFVGLLH